MDFDSIIAKALEDWLKERRDEYKDSRFHVVDDLLDESREAHAMGFFPWSEENRRYRERDH